MKDRDLDKLFSIEESKKLAARLRSELGNPEEFCKDEYVYISKLLEKWWHREKISEEEKKIYYKNKDRIFGLKAFQVSLDNTNSMRYFKKSIYAGIMAAGNLRKMCCEHDYEKINEIFNRWWSGTLIESDQRAYYYHKYLIISMPENL